MRMGAGIVTMWEMTIDCPCCGNEGAKADAEGYFTNGQGLICGCRGSVVCDSETEPYVQADKCDCHDREAAQ